ncbi:MAG: hypothetical protein LBB50_07115, partial [Oscillospiraceae bacterium]|nr:hypothetical protein [Oscillospiraceae bacterium]
MRRLWAMAVAVAVLLALTAPAAAVSENIADTAFRTAQRYKKAAQDLCSGVPTLEEEDEYWDVVDALRELSVLQKGFANAYDDGGEEAVQALLTEIQETCAALITENLGVELADWQQFFAAYNDYYDATDALRAYYTDEGNFFTADGEAAYDAWAKELYTLESDTIEGLAGEYAYVAQKIKATLQSLREQTVPLTLAQQEELRETLESARAWAQAANSLLKAQEAADKRDRKTPASGFDYQGFDENVAPLLKEVLARGAQAEFYHKNGLVATQARAADYEERLQALVEAWFGDAAQQTRQTLQALQTARAQSKRAKQALADYALGRDTTDRRVFPSDMNDWLAARQKETDLWSAQNRPAGDGATEAIQYYNALAEHYSALAEQYEEALLQAEALKPVELDAAQEDQLKALMVTVLQPLDLLRLARAVDFDATADEADPERLAQTLRDEVLREWTPYKQAQAVCFGDLESEVARVRQQLQVALQGRLAPEACAALEVLLSAQSDNALAYEEAQAALNADEIAVYQSLFADATERPAALTQAAFDEIGALRQAQVAAQDLAVNAEEACSLIARAENLARG